MKNWIIALSTLVISNTYAIETSDLMEKYLDKAKLKEQIAKEITNLDLHFDMNLGSIDIIDGINIAGKYRYQVEPSYQNNYHTRIDKWDINTGINPGTLLKGIVDLPINFSISRNNSFFFVRQFKSKVQAMDAIPYSLHKLPLNSGRALKLNIGDFAAIPANLNLAFSAGANTSYVNPFVINAGISAFWVLSAEFTIQVFKIDETHVRLKLITKRGYDRGVNSNVNAQFKLFGVKLLDKQIERLVDRDFLQLGMSINPGSQFIVDYVFDLTNKESAEAYDQILSSAYKLKEVGILNQFSDITDLKDKMFTVFEKADKLSEEDKDLPREERRVNRIFKGFNKYNGNSRRLKLGFLITNYQKNVTYTENKINFVDRQNNSIEFFYPTYSKYIEQNFGKWIFRLKDQSFKTTFGLIPKKNQEVVDFKNPEIGLTFERKDKIFSPHEQKLVERFMVAQLPMVIAKDLDLKEWTNGERKTDARIYFQIILKSQGFAHLRDISQEELAKKLKDYAERKKNIHIINGKETERSDLENLFFIGKKLDTAQINYIAKTLYMALNDYTISTEEVLRRIMKLNEIPFFEKFGVGYLISLVPEDLLKDFIYINLEMIAKDTSEIKAQFGKMNYKAFYDEINVLQSRLSNRSYDLRLSTDDLKIEDADVLKINEENHKDVVNSLAM